MIFAYSKYLCRKIIVHSKKISQFNKITIIKLTKLLHDVFMNVSDFAYSFLFICLKSYQTIY